MIEVGVGLVLIAISLYKAHESLLNRTEQRQLDIRDGIAKEIGTAYSKGIDDKVVAILLAKQRNKKNV